MENFVLTTTPALEGFQILEYLGTINTNIVIGTNFFSDFAASFTDFFGGSSGTYQRKMDLMYDEAKAEIRKKAKKLGANAAVGLKLDFDEISGKGKSMFMLSASATACIINNTKKNDSPIIKNSLIDSLTIQNEMKRKKLIEKLTARTILLGEEEWNFITENPSLDIIILLAKDYYPTWSEESKMRFENIISLLDYNDVVKFVYPLFYPNYNEDNNSLDDSNNNVCKSNFETCYTYARLIKKCKLFYPQAIDKMIGKDLAKSLLILDFEKNTYSRDDLMSMKSILEQLDNLPDVGEKTIGKKGLLSKEKEIFVCQHGHKNEIDYDYCIDCGENIKGLKRDDVKKIDDFRLKTETLEMLFSQTD